MLKTVLGPERVDDTLVFRVYEPEAKKVEVAGDFTEWKMVKMTRTAQGIWEHVLELPISDGEKRAYKFLYDGKRWEEDRHNPYCEPDGMGGLNSLIDRDLLLIRT